MCDIEVRVVQARGLRSRAGKGKGKEALVTKPDPFAFVITGAQKKKTACISGSCDPEWNEPFVVDIGDAASFAVTVMDKGSSGKMQFLGGIELGVNGLKLDGKDRWYKLTESKKNSKKVGVTGEILLQFAIPEPKGRALGKDEMKNLKAVVDAAIARNDGTFEIEGTAIDKVPSAVQEKLSGLIDLGLGFNKFAFWPRLTMFTQLETLQLRGNQIVTVPAEVGLLVNLKKLFLNGNMLKVIPPEIGDCVLLEKLDISNNLLQTIVPDIGCLKMLEEFNASGNPIAAIPETMGECIAMETLDLSFMELTQLPEQFTHMTRLMELNMGSNRLTSLPETVGRMTRLVQLNISDNQLTDLPISLGRCVGLGKIGAGINIDRNPLKDKNMIKKFQIGVDHLMDYLDKRLTVAGNPPLQDVPRTDVAALHKRSTAQAVSGAASTSAGSLSASPRSSSDKPKQKFLQNASGKEEVGAAPGTPKGSRTAALRAAKAEAAAAVAPAPAAVAVTPVAAVDANDAMKAKLSALVQWIKATVESDLNPKLHARVASLNAEPRLETALTYARYVSILKDDLERAKTLIAGAGVILPPVPAHPPNGADKLALVKAAIGNALLEVCDVAEGMVVALSGVNGLVQTRVIAFVQIVKKMTAEIS